MSLIASPIGLSTSKALKTPPPKYIKAKMKAVANTLSNQN
jgi:hypothetical protein